MVWILGLVVAVVVAWLFGWLVARQYERPEIDPRTVKDVEDNDNGVRF